MLAAMQKLPKNKNISKYACVALDYVADDDCTYLAIDPSIYSFIYLSMSI